MRTGFRGLLLATAAIGVLGAGQASAQTGDGTGTDELAEVIVTAQRRSQSVQEVPAAITAVGGETLADTGADTTGALQYLVPGLQVGTYNAGGYNAGGTGLTIRGVGANIGSPTVSMNIDGVYQPRATLAGLAQVDVERVEVLRGPQGTLYGRNANGGAVNFISRAPTSELEGYALASYADYDEVRLQGVVNLPLAERIRVRALVDYQDRGDGFVKNVVPGGRDIDDIEALSGRLRVAIDLADDVSLDLGLTARHSEGADTYFEVFTGTNIAGAINARDAHTTSVNAPQDSDRDYLSARATLKWTLPFGQFTSISAWQDFEEAFRFDTDATNVAFLRSEVDGANETFTQEFNLSGETGRADWVFGLFFMDERTFLNNHLFIGAATTPLRTDVGKYDTRAYAAFGDVTFQASERLKLIGGIRYSRDEVRVGQLTACPGAAGEFTFESVTPRAGLQYDLDADRNIYATVSRGFKAGGVNPYACPGGVFDEYEPEKITSYEAGLKARLFDRRLTLNASVFFYDYTNLQVSQLVGLTTFVSNAAGAEVRGLELEAAWTPSRHFGLNANLSLTDAEYTTFFNIDGLAPARGSQDLSGNRLNFTPKTSANLGAYYTTGETEAGTFTVRADVSYRSRIYFREFNAQADSTPAYGVLNLNLSWDSPDGRHTVRVFGNNLTKEDYRTRMISASFTGARLGIYGPPRQVGVELKSRF